MKNNKPLNFLAVATIVSTILVATPALSAQPAAVTQALQDLRVATGVPVSVKKNKRGYATHIGVNPAKNIVMPDISTAADPNSRAQSFANRYSGLFIKAGEKLDLRPQRKAGKDKLGFSHSYLRQHYGDVPVAGSYVNVTMKDSGITEVFTRLVPDFKGISRDPTIGAKQAITTAQEIITKRQGSVVVSFSKPELQIYDQSIFRSSASSRPRLAWYIEVHGKGVRDLIWIDAHSGNLVRRVNQMKNAKNRLTYDAQHQEDVLPGVLRYTETTKTVRDRELEHAHRYTGSTYDFYFNRFARDSYDEAGATLISSVRACDSGECPDMENAYWNGEQMVYGTGYASSEDVVGHELTHAYSEHTADFIYQFESGALDESYADIFGEAIQLANSGSYARRSERWEIGEYLPDGPLRDMMDPTLFEDPDKVTSPYFYCGEEDEGGVHTNSGVPNHAFALMVDGGTFNRRTVRGIGITKAAAIHYRTVSTKLGATSTLADNYIALKSSCNELIGGSEGISFLDCRSVRRSLKAVELDIRPCEEPPVDLCPMGTTPNYLFQDGFEDINSGSWSYDNISGGVDHWTGAAGVPPIYSSSNPNSGTYSLRGQDIPDVGDSAVAMTSSVVLPAAARIQFAHDFDTEFESDGGVVEYSTDNGLTWSDANIPFYTEGKYYTVTLEYDPDQPEISNPLGARGAYSGSSYGYVATQLDLSPLYGQSVRFRFRMGTDDNTAVNPWYVDDVKIYTCE